ncbi:MAG: hypothetical protein HY884_09420 [Deltaproteobacteria bacterium]|nr:hypothetical protein [Deltaproteobacteria bacterium]
MTCASTSAASNPEVFMSADVEGRQRSDKFDCHDGIYIHGVFSGLKTVKHEAYAVWFRPDGREQDRADYSIVPTLQRGNASADARFWFWLSLSPSFGGKILKTIDPSYGMEEFIGLWKVDLYLDEKLVATKVFFVAC